MTPLQALKKLREAAGPNRSVRLVTEVVEDGGQLTFEFRAVIHDVAGVKYNLVSGEAPTMGDAILKAIDALHAAQRTDTLIGYLNEVDRLLDQRAGRTTTKAEWADGSVARDEGLTPQQFVDSLLDPFRSSAVA